MIGQRIYAEARSRGHTVAVFARPTSDLKVLVAPTKVVTGDASKPDDVARAVKGQSAVISSLAPRGDMKDFLPLNQALVTGLQQAGVRRLLVVGGAGSLEVAPGVLLLDSEDFPKEWLGYAKTHAEVLNFLKTTDLKWTYISPPTLIQPGEKTGHYRRGENQLLIDEKGKSEISAEDYAVALIDELESPTAIGKRITVAY